MSSCVARYGNACGSDPMFMRSNPATGREATGREALLLN